MRRLLALTAVLHALGCGGGAQTVVPTPVHDGDLSGPGDQRVVSQTTVALRVTREVVEDPKRKVRVLAVVHDRDGNETVTDLGLFEGAVEQQPMGDELVRLEVEEPEGKRTLSLRAQGGFLEASDGGTVLERIPLPAGDPVTAEDPAVQKQE